MASYTEDDAVTYVWRVLRDLGDSSDAQLLTDTEITAFLRVAELRYRGDIPRAMVEDVIAKADSHWVVRKSGDAGEYV